MNRSKLAFPANAILAPRDCLKAMLAHTSADGILYIPAWPYDDSTDEDDHFYRCKMNWNGSDCESVWKTYQALQDSLARLAQLYDLLSEEKEKNKQRLSDVLFHVWDTYLRGFDLTGMDMKKIQYVIEKQQRLAEGESEEALTQEETALYDAYREKIFAEAEKRIGGQQAYDVIARARRLCRLQSLHAPDILLNNEGSLLIQALALNQYAEEVETVDTIE